MGFLRPNDRLNVSTLTGWSDFLLLAPLVFQWRGRLLRVRTGASTDGLSSPKWIKCDLQSTNSFFPTVAHDGFYRGDIEESLDAGKTWNRVSFEKSEADVALHDLCVDNFVPYDVIELIVTAVVEFGQNAWDADAALRNRPNT